MDILLGAKTLAEILDWAQKAPGVHLTALDGDTSVDGYTELDQPQYVVRGNRHVSLPVGVGPQTVICAEMVEHVMQRLELVDVNGVSSLVH